MSDKCERSRKTGFLPDLIPYCNSPKFRERNYCNQFCTAEYWWLVSFRMRFLSSGSFCPATDSVQLRLRRVFTVPSKNKFIWKIFQKVLKTYEKSKCTVGTCYALVKLRKTEKLENTF